MCVVAREDGAVAVVDWGDGDLGVAAGLEGVAEIAEVAGATRHAEVRGDRGHRGAHDHLDGLGEGLVATGDALGEGVVAAVGVEAEVVEQGPRDGRGTAASPAFFLAEGEGVDPAIGHPGGACLVAQLGEHGGLRGEAFRERALSENGGVLAVFLGEEGGERGGAELASVELLDLEVGAQQQRGAGDEATLEGGELGAVEQVAAAVGHAGLGEEVVVAVVVGEEDPVAPEEVRIRVANGPGDAVEQATELGPLEPRGELRLVGCLGRQPS